MSRDGVLGGVDVHWRDIVTAGSWHLAHLLHNQSFLHNWFSTFQQRWKVAVVTSFAVATLFFWLLPILPCMDALA